MGESKADEVRAFVHAGTDSIDPDAVVSMFFDADGTIGGIGVGTTTKQLQALGFEVPDAGGFHQYTIDPDPFESQKPKHRFEYALEDGVVCRVEYVLFGTNDNVERVAKAFLDAVESELGEATSHVGTERWMVGDDAQFVLERTGSKVEVQKDFEEKVLASVSFMIWDGDGEEFPGSFDPKPLETALRTYVASEFGEKISLGEIKIWKESPYVYFNVAIDSPEGELDLDWDGSPLEQGTLTPKFRALLKNELALVLDL